MAQIFCQIWKIRIWTFEKNDEQKLDGTDVLEAPKMPKSDADLRLHNTGFKMFFKVNPFSDAICKLFKCSALSQIKEQTLSHNSRGSFATLNSSWTVPYKTDGNSTLLWNGQIFYETLRATNGSSIGDVFNHLSKSGNVPSTLAEIQGGFSLIYYQHSKGKLWFSKDYLGSKSLIMKLSPDRGNLILSSVMNKTFKSAIEVPDIGIFAFDLATSTLAVYPWALPDQNFDQKVTDLKTVLGINVSILQSVFQRRRDFSNLYLEPKPQHITYYGETLFSVTGDGNSDVSESSDPKEINALELVAFNIKDNQEENLENSITPMEKRENKSLEAMDTEKMELVMNHLLKKPEVHHTVRRVLSLLKESIRLRVQNMRSICESSFNSYKLGILFSGSVDSTVLAALANEFVSLEQSIDLINVTSEHSSEATTINTEKSSTFWCARFGGPDRETSMQALAELQESYPNRRWNLIKRNIRKIQIDEALQDTIDDLVYPNTTVAGTSLGRALWFASERSGVFCANGSSSELSCTHVLLGNGANELFGGYSRHRTTLQTKGWSALTEELNAELMNTSNMNVAVVDRVSSIHGVEPNFPYLDHKLIEYVCSLNAWERCFPTESMPDGLGDKLLLRLVAYELGLRKTATVPRQPIEIGSGMVNIFPATA